MKLPKNRDNMEWLRELTIPAEVFLNPNLTYPQMFVFSLIEKMDPCPATNRQLARLLNMDVKIVQKAIEKLLELRYLAPIRYNNEERELYINPLYKKNNFKYVVYFHMLEDIKGVNRYTSLIEFWNNLPNNTKKLTEKNPKELVRAVNILNSLGMGNFCKDYPIKREFLTEKGIVGKKFGVPWSEENLKKGLTILANRIYSDDSEFGDKEAIPYLDLLLYDPENRTSQFIGCIYKKEELEIASTEIRKLTNYIINKIHKIKKISLGFRKRMELSYQEKIENYYCLIKDLIKRDLTDLEEKHLKNVVLDLILKFESLNPDEIGGNHFSVDMGVQTDGVVCGDPTNFFKNYWMWLRNVKYDNGFPIQPAMIGMKTIIWKEYCNYVKDTLGYNLSYIMNQN